MSNTEPAGVEEESRFRGRGWSFCTSAAGAALGAMACGLMRWDGVEATVFRWAPGALVLLGLLLVGPPARPGPLARWEQALRAGLMAALAWPLVAVAFVPEKESAFLCGSLWVLALGAGLVGWRARQQDPDLPLVAMGLTGSYLLAGGYGGAFEASPVGLWWAGVTVWLVFGGLLTRPLRRASEGSLPLIGATGWFVLAVMLLTIQEYRSPWLHLVPADAEASWAAWRAEPWLGWGLGASDRVLLEFAQRDPETGPWTASGWHRLLIELGALPFGALLVGVVAVLAAAARRRHWNRARTLALGGAGLWLLAMLSTRSNPLEALPAAAFLLPGALGNPADRDEARPPRQWALWAAASALVAGAALGPWLGKRHYEAQNPEANLEARSLLPFWTRPLRERASLIKEKSPDIAARANPLDWMEPVVEDWLAAAPHDVFAHAEAIRLAWARGDPAAAERAARQAAGRLPWSDVPAAWVVRLRLEARDPAGALAFLDAVQERRGGALSPMLRRTRAEAAALARALATQPEVPADGDGNGV